MKGFLKPSNCPASRRYRSAGSISPLIEEQFHFAFAEAVDIHRPSGNEMLDLPLICGGQPSSFGQ